MYFQIINVEWHVDKTKNFRHNFLFAFNRGAEAAKIAREIFAVRRKRAIPQGTAHLCFSHFKKRNFEFKERGHTGRPVDFDKERLNHFYTNIHTKRSENSWGIWSVKKNSGEPPNFSGQ